MMYVCLYMLINAHYDSRHWVGTAREFHRYFYRFSVWGECGSRSNCLRKTDRPCLYDLSYGRAGSLDFIDFSKISKEGNMLSLFAQYRQPRSPSLKMFDFGWKMHIFANCYVFQRKKSESIFVCNIDSVIICCWKRLCIWTYTSSIIYGRAGSPDFIDFSKISKEGNML